MAKTSFDILRETMTFMSVNKKGGHVSCSRAIEACRKIQAHLLFHELNKRFAGGVFVVIEKQG